MRLNRSMSIAQVVSWCAIAICCLYAPEALALSEPRDNVCAASDK
ncbi:hypothetical protein FB547_1092 [Variovorax beijingensis]|uniref:Uncharacterized protein n=1 Tax=Variovorax beijingensis TaxID=2496117 RepID=A0A561BF74_9BURK|nr:hypothetical protein FB547_1092 [Variovorax beijingensis]